MGKTKRHNPSSTAVKHFITIQEVKPFTVTDGESWNGRKIKVKELGVDLMQCIPQHIMWDLSNEETLSIGLQALANFFDIKIHEIVEGGIRSSIPKAALTHNFNYSGGAPLSFTHTKAPPKTIVIHPIAEEEKYFHNKGSHKLRTALKAYDGVQITLGPNSNHYMFNCEYRKVPVGPCPTCFYVEGRTTWLKGLGHKSSKKTKGMKKILKRTNDFMMYS
jgi:hypothetical protein